jgi:Predicted permeases
MWQAFAGIFGILLISGLGYYLSRINFMDASATRFVTKLATKVTIPCMLFKNAVTNFTPEFLETTGFWLLIPLLIIIFLHAMAYGIAKLLHIRKGDTGVFCAMISMPNTLSIGLPITLAIFGVTGIPYVMAFYVSTAVFFWGYAVNWVARDGGQMIVGKLEAVKRIFSPPLLAFLLGAGMNMVHVPLPNFIAAAVENLGGMTTPLTLLLTGSILADMGRDAFKLDKAGAVTLVGRLLLSPVVCLLICLAVSVPMEMTRNYTVQAGLPSMNQVLLMSKYYGANDRLCAQMLMLTTLLSLVTIPLTVLVLGMF